MLGYATLVHDRPWLLAPSALFAALKVVVVAARALPATFRELVLAIFVFLLLSGFIGFLLLICRNFRILRACHGIVY